MTGASGLLRERVNRSGLPLVSALLCVAMASMTPEPTRADEGEADRLVVGVENIAYLPAYGIAEDGAYVGFARDLLDAFAADAGYAIEYVPLPVPRLYRGLANGSVDLKFPDNPSWRPDFRAAHTLHYSVPVLAYLDASLVPMEVADSVTVADVGQLGTVSGFTPWPWLDQIEAGSVTVTENGDFVALVRQALAGRVDAAYANVAVVNRVLDREFDSPGALAFAPGLPHDRGEYRLSTIDRPDVIAAFDAWMESKTDRVAALKARHGAERGVQTGE